MKDFYSTLEISRDAETDEIKKAFREKAKIFHPDRVANEDDKSKAAQQFIAIKTAYDVLSNPEKRVEYDENLRRQEELERLQQEFFIRSGARGGTSKDMSQIIIEFERIMQIIYQYHEETIRRHRDRPFYAEDFGMDSEEWSYTGSFSYNDYQRARQNIKSDMYYRPIGVVAYWLEGSLTFVRLANTSWKAQGTSLKEAVTNLAEIIGRDIGRKVDPESELSKVRQFSQDPHEMYPQFDLQKIIIFFILMTLSIYGLKYPQHWLYVVFIGIGTIIIFILWHRLR